MDVLSFSLIADRIKKKINHKAGLNLSQTRILLFFDNNNNESLTMGKLAKDLNISLSTLSRQLQQKKTQEYIEIIRSDNDSSKSVRLSEFGVKKAYELKIALQEIETQLFKNMDNKNVERFLAELKQLCD